MGSNISSSSGSSSGFYSTSAIHSSTRRKSRPAKVKSSTASTPDPSRRKIPPRWRRRTYWSPSIMDFIRPPFFLPYFIANLWINIHFLVLPAVFAAGTAVGHSILHKGYAHTSRTCVVTALVGSAVFIPSFWIVFKIADSIKFHFTGNRWIGDIVPFLLARYMMLRTAFLTVPCNVIITVLGTAILRRSNYPETIGSLAEAARVGALGGAFTLLFSEALIVMSFSGIFYGSMYFIYEPCMYRMNEPVEPEA